MFKYRRVFVSLIAGVLVLSLIIGLEIGRAHV